MKKAALRSPLKILSATSVAIFSLLAVFTSTAAWFDSVRNVQNGANFMPVEPLEHEFTLNVHHAVHADKNAYYFHPTPTTTVSASSQGVNVVLEDALIDLDPREEAYSLTDPYHPLLITVEYGTEIEATSATPLNIFAKTDSYFICETVTDEYSAGLQADDNPLSSIIKGYSFGYDTIASSSPTDIPTQDYSSTEDCLYFSASDLASADKKFSFATISGEQASFSHYVDFFRKSSGAYNKVAIIIEYDPDLIEYICNSYLGNELLNDTINFVCDWTTFI